MEIFTIGHSNYKIDKFIELLEQYKITAIADVRSVPYSRYNPQYNRENIKRILNNYNIEYAFLGKELGARTDNLNCYINNKVVYELLAGTKEFLEGLERIKIGLNKYNIALMCAEKDPINCHRSILICRHLRKEVSIKHILDNGEVESHQQLEKRLLRIINFKKQQLSLFDNISLKLEEEQLEYAYQIYGEKIAYSRKKV